MKKVIKSLLASIMIVPLLALGVSAFFPSVSAFADASSDISGGIQGGVNKAQGSGVPTTLFGGSGSIFTTVVNILLFLIGAISVIMLIIGGIRYTLSGGAATEVQNAKNTILYAIIGIVVAFLAFAIVNWVLGSLTSGTSSTS
jgi:hypothetical protein